MKRPQVIALLIAAAVAVGIQNYVFFTSQPEALRAGERNEWDEEASRANMALGPVTRSALHAWRDGRPGIPRNPFLTADEAAPSGAVVVSAARPTLDGTLWSAERKVAWINGRPHSEGDRVGEHLLERIDPQSIVLRKGIEVWTLGLKGSAPRHEASHESD